MPNTIRKERGERAQALYTDTMTKLGKNFLYNTAYQLLTIILPLITAPYVSRVLGVSGIGTYSFIYSIAYYFCLCGMLGVSNHGNRSIALVKGNRKKLSHTFWSIYTIQLATTLLSLFVYLIFVSTMFTGNKTIAYIDTLFLLSYVLDINWLFWGLEEFQLTVTRNMVFKVAATICTYIFVKSTGDLWKYTLILSLGTALSQSFLWTFLRKRVDFVKPTGKEIISQIKPVIVLFIPVIAYSIYKVMDKIMLGEMASVEQVGLYENAEKMIGIPMGVITAFGTVMMPRISALTAENDVEQIDTYNRLSFKYFSILAIGMTSGLIGISAILPEVYFGAEFIESGPLIAGLSFTLIFMTWANIIRTQYLIPAKRDFPYVISTICGAILNLAVNFKMIPVCGAKGALVGTVLAEFSVFFAQAMFVRRDFFVLQYLKPVVPYFVFGAVMCAIVYHIGIAYSVSIKTLLLQIFLGATAYCLCVVVHLYMTKDQIVISVLTKIKTKFQS